MITVSIVTYKTDLAELTKCLHSLSSPLVSKVYIIDNSSQKYIADFCKEYAYVEYSASKNAGYGAGHNQALRKVLNSSNTYHLVLNSDVYFEPDVLEQLVKYMDSNEDVAQVQPNIIYPDGRMQYTCRLLPTPVDLIFRRFLPKKMVEKRNNQYTLKFNDHTQAMNIPHHQGSFMFFRIECFNKTGLFDERFFMYLEDIDLTRRIHKYYRTMFWPGVTIVHAHRAASYKSKKMLIIHIRNAIKYFNKWGWAFDSERKKWNKRLLKELL